MGFEPTTASLEGWNSTTELHPPYSKIYLQMTVLKRNTFFIFAAYQTYAFPNALNLTSLTDLPAKV